MPTHLTQEDTELWLTLALRGEVPDCTSLADDDEQKIFDTASTHGILSLLQHCIATTSDSPNCSSIFLDKVKRHHTASVAAEMYRHHELTGLFTKFSAADIPCLLMKGGALAHSLYPHPHLRERCDTDILFPDKSTTEKAWKILEQEGYERKNTLDGDFVGYQFSCTRLLGAGFPSSLDIHSKLNDYGFFAHSFSFAELLQNSIPVPQLGPSVRGLKHTYALVHACIHRVTNIPHGIENRLIWIYDIHLLCKSFSGSDWQEFCTLAGHKKIAGLCLDGLEKSEEIFSTTITEHHRLQMLEDAGKEKISPHKMNKRWQMYYLDFMSNKGIGSKLRQVREHLFPSARYMTEKYKPKSKLLLPFYYILRPFRGLKKYF